MKQSFEIAESICNDIVNKYEADRLPGLPDRFHYIQAIFLFAIERCYKICKEKQYFDYIKSWADCRIDENGVILNQHDLLDDMMPAVLLINLYKETGEKKYKTALESTIEKMRNWKCNEYGGFYHMYKTPNQVWLDGLFMAGVLLTQYAKEFEAPEFFDVMALQAEIMYEHIRKKDTGLYFHAWDPSKLAEWADKETGLSRECWGRAMGWVAFALCDMLEVFPEKHAAYGKLKKQLYELLKALSEYQDKKSGLWYQVTDRCDRVDNWIETSCSCLFAYAFHKAVRLGFVEGRDLASITLPGSQIALLEELKKIGKPMIALMIQGRPYEITRAYELSDAMLTAWYPGQQGAPAIFDVLTGRINPSGKLSVFIPYSAECLPAYYNRVGDVEAVVDDDCCTNAYADYPRRTLFPFGYGLSYASFAYSDIKAKKIAGNEFEISVLVENTSEIAGKEVIQLYIHGSGNSVKRRARELKGFQKVFLNAHEKKRVVFKLGYDELKIYSARNRFEIENGIVTVFVGGSSAAELKVKIETQIQA